MDVFASNQSLTTQARYAEYMSGGQYRRALPVVKKKSKNNKATGQ